MDIADKELIADFVVESQEGLADVERQMLAIEAAGENIDAELVNAVFRTMHSIKGAAGFLGLDRIGALAHRLEELLNLMRNRDLIPTTELVTIMLKAADFMGGLISAVDSSNEADISSHVEAMEHFLSKTMPTGDSVVEPAPPTTITPGQSNVSPAVTREFLIESYDNLEQMDRDLLLLEQSPNNTDILRSIFRTMHTIKGGAGFLGFRKMESLAHAAEGLLGKLRDGSLTISSSILSALLEAIEQCRQGLKLIEERGGLEAFDPTKTIELIQKAETANPCSEAPVAKLATAPVLESQGSPPSAAAPLIQGKSIPAASAAEACSEKAQSSVGDSTIRVDVCLLDKLMTRVGELVLARNQILQHASRVESAEMNSAAQRLNLITSELQEGVMKTRMQPIGNVWAKFPRVVRDLAFQLKKQISIELDGKETELDKTIIEAIKDPLTHLVRNSVDHGIETPALRIAAGKHPEGRLLLRAYHEGGQVNIEITDDGAGLNLDRIRKKAVERGILSSEQVNRLTDHETAQLIFAAGFSTAEQVTSVSGRGVGMDVVKTNIERIGGVIDLQSRPGNGTTVKIKIPLTLAIIPALTVVCEGDRYAIPQVNLLELVRLEGEEARSGIESIHGAPVYRLRGKLLPLVYLSERLGLSHGASQHEGENATDKAVNIVVMRADDRQFGLIVDKVCDTEEIVVKPLGKQLKRISEYAGTTIMGDGDVALILDVKGLASASGLSGELRSHSPAESNDESQNRDETSESVLLVDVGDQRRFALPISMVARLEKIASAAIERADRREVIQYRGEILPLMRLTDVVGVAESGMTDPEEVQVVVYQQQDQAFGLIVRRIIDSCEVLLKTRPSDAPPGHLLGSYVIQQRVTDVVDLHHLGRSLRQSSLATQI
jgi:two-component system chemotaxis sensor kinase CheA